LNHGKSRSIVNRAGISGVVACLVTIVAAAEQGDTADRLLECDRLSDPELKLACYDAVVTGLKEGESPEPSEDRPQNEAQTDLQEQDDEVMPAAPDQSATALPAAGAAAADSSAMDEDFGLEDQRAAEQREEERAAESEESLEATIVKVTVHSDRRFSVQLDNGQVWRETQGTRVGVPKEGAAVVITAGKLGGYRMTIDGIARQAWVRRMK
jgi:hypothetical protein